MHHRWWRLNTSVQGQQGPTIKQPTPAWVKLTCENIVSTSIMTWVVGSGNIIFIIKEIVLRTIKWETWPWAVSTAAYSNGRWSRLLSSLIPNLQHMSSVSSTISPPSVTVLQHGCACRMNRILCFWTLRAYHYFWVAQLNAGCFSDPYTSHLIFSMANRSRS